MSSHAAAPVRWSEKQRQVLGWWRTPELRRRYDAIICDGAVRSGKTTCTGLSFLAWALCCQPGQDIALCGKTIRSLRRNLAGPLFERMRRMGIDCRERFSENYADLTWGSRSVRVYLFGGRDESSASLIQGMTLAGVLFDEVALMPRSFVEQALARCSVEGATFWFSCNPEHPEHWFYKEWIQKAEERRALYLHFTMQDNPALSPQVIRRYERMYTGRFYERFVLGEWTAPEGQIYDMFSTERHVAPVGNRDWQRLVISCDYGTVNPMSMGLWGLWDGVWHRLRESWYDARAEGSRRTDEQHYEALCRLAGEFPPERIEAVVIDPSAASFIECVESHRVFRVVRADNRVREGIAAVSRWLAEGKLSFDPGCEQCIREFSLYRWEDGGSERPVKEQDHAMDDLRYFVMYCEQEEKPGGFCAARVERTRR